MRNLTIILALAGIAVFASFARIQTIFITHTNALGAQVPITPELLADPTRALENFNFDEPNLDELIRFDPLGYEALGSTDAEEWTDEAKDWNDNFHVWVHTTQHARYLAVYETPYVCGEGRTCRLR